MNDQEMKLPWKLTYFLEPDLIMPAIMDETQLRTTLKDFEVRDDDVFLVTYPKAGTNWTCEILDAILNIDNLEVLKTRSLAEKVPLLEFGPSRHPDLLEDGIQDVPSIVETVLNSAPSPRRVPTHLLPKYCPSQLFTKKPKTVFIDRNPKDCLVSLFGWHQYVRFLLPVEWDIFFDAHMDGHTVYGPYPEFLKAWYEYKDEPWFLFMRYEDLKKTPKESIKKIAKFLGKDLTDDQLNKAVRVTSFDYMKKANETVKGRDFYLRPTGVWQRKGVVGDWRNRFTVAQNEAFEKYYYGRMKELGIDHLNYTF
ncbi:sulfotransferase 1 family member D1-like [Ptychodera flava]|uniref:sulfotransferase 1 family member D1-like n=1 Tax=Ptychodera flava TaxID=63121 RepID=UPI00396A93BA